jgi:hypothetical protein
MSIRHKKGDVLFVVIVWSMMLIFAWIYTDSLIDIRNHEHKQTGSSK